MVLLTSLSIRPSMATVWPSRRLTRVRVVRNQSWVEMNFNALTGNVELCAGTGRIVFRTVAVRLCRCGHSNTKPVCDGSHVAAGFVSEEPATTTRINAARPGE